MLESDECAGSPPKRKSVASIIQTPQHELGVWGILWLLLKSVRKEGSSGFYIRKDLLSLAFKRIGGAGSSALM